MFGLEVVKLQFLVRGSRINLRHTFTYFILGDAFTIWPVFIYASPVYIEVSCFGSPLNCIPLSWFPPCLPPLALICVNCTAQPRHLSLLHYLGAALSFTCICFYTIMLTELTRRCALTGCERALYPFRIVSTVLQICLTICCILFGNVCL